MDSIITALKDTPIPTIMVVAGIVFLLLSIAGQLAGRIAVPPERQRQAAIIGCLLVVVGITLHVAPLLRSQSKPSENLTSQPKPPEKTPSSSTSETPPRTSSPLPEPTTTQLLKVESLPSLDARVTAIRFFADGCHTAPSPQGQRKYARRFRTGGLRALYAIYTEVTLEYPTPERRIYFNLKGIYQSEDKGVLDTKEERTYIPIGQQSSVHWISSCGYPKGVGFYMVDVYINEQKVGSGSFEMYLDQ